MIILQSIRITMLKVLCISMLAVGFMISGLSCNNPKPASVEYEEIDTTHDPLQNPYESDEVIRIEIKEGTFALKPVATYRLAGMVVGRESYSYGWSGEIAPLDLALAWGDLAAPDYDTYIHYSQSDRWYFFTYTPGGPFSVAFISQHSSNNHIIPATKNIFRALKGVKETQKIVLEGFLVNLQGTYKGQQVGWNSSLSRSDTGQNSCELFYVQKARVGEYIYE